MWGYSQAWIFHQHYLIPEDHLIRHPQMASPTQELLQLVAGKNSLPQKRVLKHLLSGLQHLRVFEGKEASLMQLS